MKLVSTFSMKSSKQFAATAFKSSYLSFSLIDQILIIILIKKKNDTFRKLRMSLYMSCLLVKLLVIFSLIKCRITLVMVSLKERSFGVLLPIDLMSLRRLFKISCRTMLERMSLSSRFEMIQLMVNKIKLLIDYKEDKEEISYYLEFVLIFPEFRRLLKI